MAFLAARLWPAWMQVLLRLGYPTPTPTPSDPWVYPPPSHADLQRKGAVHSKLAAFEDRFGPPAPIEDYSAN